MGRPRRTLLGLALASHPGPTVVVTGLAAGLAAGLGSTARTAVLVSAAVLTGQLSVGWSNDWIDARRDQLVRRGDKPAVRGLVTVPTLRLAALAAAAACVPLSLSTGSLPGSVHLVAVAAAWAYNVRLKSTAASWVPYAVSFGLLCLFVVLAQPGRPVATWWAVTAAALLGVGAHLANVLPDLEQDAATGVHGLPHRLGRARATRLALASLVAAACLVVLGPAGSPGLVSWLGGGLAVLLAAIGGVVARVRWHSKAPFRLSMAVAAVCVALLVLAGPELAQT